MLQLVISQGYDPEDCENCDINEECVEFNKDAIENMKYKSKGDC